MNQDDKKKKEVISNMLAGWFGKWADDIEPTKQTQSSNHGWVSIKERLPNKDGKYLVHYQTQVLCDGRYLPKFDVVNYSSCIRHFDFYHDHITHWQPLPEPPLYTGG